MNYYNHHIGDYAKDTAHLSMLEDGAYRRLLDICYATEKPLPSDERAIFRLVRAQTKAEREAVKAVLGDFFKLKDDGWHQKRCDEEIAAATEKSQKARDSAGKRWQGKHNANAMRTHMPTQCEGNAPSTPIANSQEPIAKVSNNPQRSATSPAVEIAVALRKRGVKGANAMNPVLQEWVQKGVSLEHAMEAARIAIDERGKKDPGLRYLDPIIAELRGQNGTHHASMVKAKPWFIDTWSALEAKAKELGIEQRKDEPPPTFRRRVLKAAGVTSEQVEKAEAEWR